LFRVPLAGLLCTFEFASGFEPGEFDLGLIIPAAFSHLVAYWLTSSTGWPTPFATFLAPNTITLAQLALLVAVGLASGVAAVAYVLSIRWSKKQCGKLGKRIPMVFLPVIGASVSTALGALFPIILGDNFLAGTLSDAPKLSLIMLFGAIVAKIIAVAAADGFFLAGGTVGPGIKEGGMIGILLAEVAGLGRGFNPMFAAAGAACFIGPVTGLPLTLLFLAATRLRFAPIAWLIIIPLACSYIICRKTPLYPLGSTTPEEKK
jgi:H+/Cl- antiporter ClcA